VRRIGCALAVIALLAGVADADRKKKKPRAKKPVPAQVEPEPEIEFDPEPSSVAPATQPASLDPEPAVALDITPVAPAKAKRKRFYLRAGIVHVAPLAVSREMELADIDGAASLAVQNGPIAGSGSDVSSSTVPGLIIGYVLPWMDGKLAIETVIGAPLTVKFKATGTLANESIAPTALGIPTGVMPLGSELGEAKAAPPTLTLVYSLKQRGPVQPFVGAGIAVMFAYDAKVTNPMLTEVSQPTMDIAPAPGLVFQGGLEAKLYKGIYARLDVKFIALMMARAEVHHIQVRTPELPLFDTVEVGTATMSVWVNPLIVQAGIGLDF